MYSMNWQRYSLSTVYFKKQMRISRPITLGWCNGKSSINRSSRWWLISTSSCIDGSTSVSQRPHAWTMPINFCSMLRRRAFLRLIRVRQPLSPKLHRDSRSSIRKKTITRAVLRFPALGASRRLAQVNLWVSSSYWHDLVSIGVCWRPRCSLARIMKWVLIWLLSTFGTFKWPLKHVYLQFYSNSLLHPFWW